LPRENAENTKDFFRDKTQRLAESGAARRVGSFNTTACATGDYDMREDEGTMLRINRIEKPPSRNQEAKSKKPERKFRLF